MSETIATLPRQPLSVTVLPDPARRWRIGIRGTGRFPDEFSWYARALRRERAEGTRD